MPLDFVCNSFAIHSIYDIVVVENGIGKKLRQINTQPLTQLKDNADVDCRVPHLSNVGNGSLIDSRQHRQSIPRHIPLFHKRN